MFFSMLYLQLCRLNTHLDACSKQAKLMRSEDRNSTKLSEISFTQVKYLDKFSQILMLFISDF